MKIVVSACVIILVCSCGMYSFSGGGYPGINSVSIPMFEDRSAEFQIREKLTEAVIDKFLRDNTLKLVDEDHADSVVRGTILRVDDRPIALSENEQAQEFEVYVTLQIEYEDLQKHRMIFSETFQGRGTFSDLAQRTQAVDEAIEKISTDILNRVVSGW